MYELMQTIFFLPEDLELDFLELRFMNRLLLIFKAIGLVFPWTHITILIFAVTTTWKPLRSFWQYPGLAPYSVLFNECLLVYFCLLLMHGYYRVLLKADGFGVVIFFRQTGVWQLRRVGLERHRFCWRWLGHFTW